MTPGSFVIDKVSWHTSTAGNTETREETIRRFFIVATFLQDRGLAKRCLVRDLSDVDDDFALASEDLTPRGLRLMKKAYDGWLQRVDAGMDPADVSFLSKALDAMKE